MTDKKTILLEMMDVLSSDLRRFEQQFGLQTNKHDLRPPIDYYMETIAIWASGASAHQNLSVSRISDQLSTMRQRARWVQSGAQIYWQERYSDYEGLLAQAKKFKRFAIRNPSKITIPSAVMQADIRIFYDAFGHNTQGLGAELSARYAERYHYESLGRHLRGSWRRLQPEDFLSGMQYLRRHYPKLIDTHMPSQHHDLMVSLQSFAPPSQALVTNNEDEMGTKALKNIWIQIQHPLAIHTSLNEKTDGSLKQTYAFRSDYHIPESRWQQMGALGALMADGYNRFAVLFAAALADTVHANYKKELEGLDDLVRDTAQLLHQIEQLEQGGKNFNIAQLERLLKEIKNPKLRERIQAILDSMRVDTSSSSTQSGKPAVNQLLQQTEADIEALEAQYFNFCTAQLSVYEQCKDLVKQLASKGLNLAGKFTEAALATAQGRGKGGQGR